MTDTKTVDQIQCSINREMTTEDLFNDAFSNFKLELMFQARKWFSDTDQAEDIVQDTFVRAWRSRESFDSSMSSIRTWLHNIERNVIFDTLKKRSRFLSVSTVGYEFVAPDSIEIAMLRWCIVEALSKLKKDYRVIVVEVYFKSRTSSDLACMLKIPEGTVRSRLHYALQSLKSILEDGESGQ